MNKVASKLKTESAPPIDLSEYEEEAIPFDKVIRQLAKAKLAPVPVKPNTKAKARAKK